MAISPSIRLNRAEFPQPDKEIAINRLGWVSCSFNNFAASIKPRIGYTFSQETLIFFLLRLSLACELPLPRKACKSRYSNTLPATSAPLQHLEIPQNGGVGRSISTATTLSGVSSSLILGWFDDGQQR